MHPFLVKWGKLQPVTKKDDGYNNIFNVSAGSQRFPLTASKSIMVMSDGGKNPINAVRSFDPAYLAFLESLSDMLQKECPPDIDANGSTRNGIHDDWSKMRTVAGYLQSPMEYKPMDNSNRRLELGLRAELDGLERAVYSELFHIIWSEFRPSAINLPKLSTSGPPRDTKEPQLKKDFAFYAYDNLDKILDLVRQKKWLDLANDFELIWLIVTQKRVQVDSFGKVRKSADLKYALTNGKEGRLVETDKKVVIDGVHYPNHVAARVRNVDACPWAINCLLQPIASGVLQSMFERFPLTFHINTKEAIEDVVRGTHFVASDISEFDKTFPFELIELFFNIGKEYWREEFMDMAIRLMGAPYFTRPVDREGKTKPLLVGELFADDNQVKSGNRSGHAFTSVLAKVGKCGDTLVAMAKCGLPVLGRVQDILQHKDVWKMVNNGDDELICSENATIMRKFSKFRFDVKHGIGVFKSEPEVGRGFSGFLIMDEVVGQPELLRYKAVPKASTAIEKPFIPERGVDDVIFRPFWPTGNLQRINSLDQNPSGQLVWECAMKCWQDHLSPKVGSFYSLNATALARLPMPVGQFSYLENLVLMDSSKLHYMVSENDIRDEVRDKIVSRISKEEVSFYTEYYDGVLI